MATKPHKAPTGTGEGADPCAPCRRLSRHADALDIHDTDSGPYRTRLMQEARAGDCAFSHSCPTRRRCRIAPQTFQIHPSPGYFKPTARAYTPHTTRDALPSATRALPREY